MAAGELQGALALVKWPTTFVLADVIGHTYRPGFQARDHLLD